jgi:hypothetical protein
LKISARTRGLLANGTGAEAVPLVIHVKTVLTQRRLARVLEEICSIFRIALAERKLIAEANRLLEFRDGVSERNGRKGL